MVSIAGAVGRIKEDLADLVNADRIVEVCKQAGHGWRDGPLNPVTTIHLFMLQVLHGNTAMNHLRQLAGICLTASAYCQARMRVPLVVFERLVCEVNEALLGAADQVGCWRGHRVWPLDGSSFSMPDEPCLQAKFGQPSGQRQGCGFPVATLMVLMDAATGLIGKTRALPLYSHDMAHAVSAHDQMNAGDVLVADRAYGTFVHLACLLRRQMHGLFRAHQRMIVSFKPGRTHARQWSKAYRAGLPSSQWVRRLGHLDQCVRWFKPKQCPTWWDPALFKELPAHIDVRELRYHIEQLGFRTREVTLVTTLLKPEQYPKQELAEKYQQRWQIETRLRDLKQTMAMDVLKSKTVDGVLKELQVFVLIHNLVRQVCIEAARRQGVAPNRISFVDALRWLRDAPDADRVPKLIVNPDREDRHEPRVRKRRPKQYPLMTKPRHEYKQALMGKTVAA